MMAVMSKFVYHVNFFIRSSRSTKPEQIRRCIRLIETFISISCCNYNDKIKVYQTNF